MSSTPVSSPIKVATPNAPAKATKATADKKEKVVKEKVVKEKVAEKKEEVVADKKVAEKKDKKAVAEKKVKEVKAVEVVAEKAVEAVVDTKEKKARAASLPAKYGKFIQYSYYLIRAINNAALEQNGAVLVDEDQFITAAHVFDNIATQQAFVSSFLENKNIAKEMRTHLADKKKAEVVAAKAAAKAEKEAEKNAVKAAAKAEKDAAKAAAKPAKQPKQPKQQTQSKAKKTKPTVEPDLVTSLVALANTSLAPASTGNATAIAAGNAAAENEEEELDVRVFMINAKEYLIDDNNNLYDSNTHAVIGIWNKETNTIIHA
jgi:hypothetical protein